MSIIIKKHRKIIIDRTLNEIVKESKNIDLKLTSEFLALLKDIGVDFIEINQEVLRKIKELPEGTGYIYRFENVFDAQKFEYIVLSYEKFKSLSENCLQKLKGKKIMFEVSIKDLDKIAIEECDRIFNNINVVCIRVKDVVKYNLSGWSRFIESIKDRYSVYVDFCASNKYYMATSVSLETCVDGADSITTAFNGQIYNLAPLEEVILALKIIKNGEFHGNLKSLAKAAHVYVKLTGQKVSPMKAVIGEDIFKYESGIHVDGIEKNPDNYEPYNPCDVGETRTMYIGKHSGKKAVMVKLKELNVDYEGVDMEKFLNKVRKMSTELKRNILDDELIKMFNDFKNTCLK